MADNLVIDMDNHCVLCFRECPKDSDQLERNCDVKVFLTALEKYLKLPDVTVSYVDSRDAKSLPKKLRKKWHQLIDGPVCNHCSYLVSSTSSLYLDYEVLKMRLDCKIREVDEHFQFAQDNANCAAAKQRLVDKWVKDRPSGEGEMYLELMKLLRQDLSRMASRFPQLPKVVLDASLPQSVPRPKTGLDGQNKSVVGNILKLVERQSVATSEDSGISMDSEMCPLPQIGGEMATDKPGTEPVAKEYTHWRRTYRCKTCGVKFFTKEKLSAHKNANHNAKDAITVAKNRTPEPEEAVSEHVPVSKRGRFECAEVNCDQTFSTVEDLIKHHSLTHQSIQCPTCGAACKGPYLLARHEFTEHRSKSDASMKCSRCAPQCQVFKTITEYSAHFMACHVPKFDKSVRCSKCSCILVNDDSLKRHSEICAAATAQEPESDLKSQCCNLCSSQFASLTALHSHLVAEHDPNIKACFEPGCGRMFPNVEVYDRHKADMHPGRKVKLKINFCKYCKTHKTFKSDEKFRAHIEKHEKKEQRRESREETVVDGEMLGQENKMEVAVTVSVTRPSEEATMGHAKTSSISSVQSTSVNDDIDGSSPKLPSLTKNEAVTDSTSNEAEACSPQLDTTQSSLIEEVSCFESSANCVQAKTDTSISQPKVPASSDVETIDLVSSDDEDEETHKVPQKDEGKETKKQSQVLQDRVKAWLRLRRQNKLVT